VLLRGLLLREVCGGADAEVCVARRRCLCLRLFLPRCAEMLAASICQVRTRYRCFNSRQHMKAESVAGEYKTARKRYVSGDEVRLAGTAAAGPVAESPACPSRQRRMQQREVVTLSLMSYGMKRPVRQNEAKSRWRREWQWSAVRRAGKMASFVRVLLLESRRTPRQERTTHVITRLFIIKMFRASA